MRRGSQVDIVLVGWKKEQVFEIGQTLNTRV